MTHIEQIVNVLKDHRVFIQTHNTPDPDALASAYGLQYLLSTFGIMSTIVYDGEINKISGLKLLEYLDFTVVPYKEVKNLSEEDYVVLVDSQKYNRNCTDIPGDEVVCIDHHPTFYDCEYQFKDVRIVGSCSSLICSYFIEAGIEMNSDVATALLYGLKTDTADFNRGVTDFDLEMFQYLFKIADDDILRRISVNSIALSDLKAYGAAINDITVYKSIGFACIPFNCPDALVAIISDFILALDVIGFSVVFCERNGGYKFSIRSEIQEINCGSIVSYVMSELGGNGGGHGFMSGGFIPEEAVRSLGRNPRKEIEFEFMRALYPEDFPGSSKVIG